MFRTSPPRFALACLALWVVQLVLSLLLAWRKDNDNPVLAGISASLAEWLPGVGDFSADSQA